MKNDSMNSTEDNGQLAPKNLTLKTQKGAADQPFVIRHLVFEHSLVIRF
jgi:hypothetical protein